MSGSEDGKKGYDASKTKLDAYKREKSRLAREAYEANPNICPTCNRVLPYEERRNKFCNKSCAATYNNQGVTRHAAHPEHCASCGSRKEKRHNTYCDACIAKNVYIKKLTSVEEAKNDKTRRSILLEQRGQRCEECGLTEWRGYPIPVEMDHIDGDPDNNTDVNLRLVCPNCHALTESYKGKGKVLEQGRFSKRRIMRRKRYSDGKSW